MTKPIIIVTIVIFITNIAAAQNPDRGSRYPQQYICYKTDKMVTINGELKEEAWREAKWTNHFVDIEGNKKQKPHLNTRVKMLWDEDHLYIAAELEEPHIWANITVDESVIYYDNDFEVFIDPDGDYHNYAEIEINALGTYWDLLLTKPYKDLGMPITSWDIKGLKSAVKIYGTINNPDDKDSMWTIEMALPWRSFTELHRLKRAPENGDLWRINFSRVQWHTDIIDGNYVKRIDKNSKRILPEMNWVWSEQGVIDMHRPEKWGYLQFSDAKTGSETPLLRDPYFESKQLLMEIYNRQKAYYHKNGKYSESLQELNFLSLEKEKITIEATGSQFKAFVVDVTGKVWYITHERELGLIDN